MKSGIGKGGGVSPWSEDWYGTMGCAGVSCRMASIGTEMCVMAGIGRRAFPCAGGASWSSSLRAFLFLRVSETAAASPLLRAMRLVVVDLGRVGPLGALFPPFTVGPMGWAGGEAWEGVMGLGGVLRDKYNLQREDAAHAEHPGPIGPI